ncbi:MAG: DUF4939 domain-containing protein [Plesiomonas sp.]
MQTLVAQVSDVSAQLQQLRGDVTGVPTVPASPSVSPSTARVDHQFEPRLPPPAQYAGEPHLCRAFVTKCSLFFTLQPTSFPTEQSRVAMMITLLSGRAALWGTAVWEAQMPCCASFQAFIDELRRVFDRSVSGHEAARRLTELQQGGRSVTDYSIEFRTLAAEANWNEVAQWDCFLHGLADRVQREIVGLDLPTSLDGLIDLAVRVDSRLQRRDQLRRSNTFAEAEHPKDTVSPHQDHEPMQVGRARLTREERIRRRSNGLCLYCGSSGHFVTDCPVKAGAHQ